MSEEVLCNTEGDLKCQDCILTTDDRAGMWTFHTFLGCTTSSVTKQGDYNSVTIGHQENSENIIYLKQYSTLLPIVVSRSIIKSFGHLSALSTHTHICKFMSQCSTVQYCTVQYITVQYCTVLSATPTYAGLCTTNKIFRHTSRGLFCHSKITFDTNLNPGSIKRFI